MPGEPLIYKPDDDLEQVAQDGQGSAPDVELRLGEVADDLAISRSRARSLVLDHYAREVGREGRGIDDPLIRDLLKSFAYGRGILKQRRELAVQILKRYRPMLARIAGRAAGVPA